MKKIFFLGLDSNETRIIDVIKDKNNIKVFHKKKNIKLQDLMDIDLIISFGYKYIIKEEILKKYDNILNLHISYLPFNKGAHPNFWSFADGTPSGITIHKIDEKIDSGNIIYQKPIDFELNKNKDKLTFKNTYSVLKFEIENLFINNIKNLLNNDYDEFEQIDKGTFHKSSDLPKILKHWDQNIFDTIKNYKNRINN